MIPVNSKCKFHLPSATGSALSSALHNGEQLPHESPGPLAPWSLLFMVTKPSPRLQTAEASVPTEARPESTLEGRVLY